MQDLKFIELENGIDYYVLDEVYFKKNKYYILVNSKNNYDVVIRKEENDYLVGLKDTEELKNVIGKLIKDKKDNPEILKLINEFKNI